MGQHKPSNGASYICSLAAQGGGREAYRATAYLAGTLGVAAAAASLGPGVEDARELLQIARDPVGLVAFAVTGLIFGVVVARSIASADAMPGTQRRDDREIVSIRPHPAAPAAPEPLPEAPPRWKTWLTWVGVAAVVVLIAVQMLRSGPAPVDDDASTATEQDIEALRDIVRRNPTDAHAFYLLAWGLGLQGRYREALLAADSATKLAPDSALYQDALARALAGLTRWAEAWRTAETAVALAPDDPYLWGFVGYTAYFANEMERSRFAFEQALAIDPAYLDDDRRSAERDAWQAVSGMDLERSSPRWPRMPIEVPDASRSVPP